VYGYFNEMSALELVHVCDGQLALDMSTGLEGNQRQVLHVCAFNGLLPCAFWALGREAGVCHRDSYTDV
jgi:hypothetical protein